MHVMMSAVQQWLYWFKNLMAKPFICCPLIDLVMKKIQLLFNVLGCTVLAAEWLNHCFSLI